MSIFSAYDPYGDKIKKSQDKINQHPEIRGLIPPIKRDPITISFRGCKNGTITFEYDKKTAEMREIFEDHSVYLLYNREASVHISKWKSFKLALTIAEPNIRFINFEPLNHPFWRIEKQDKQIAVKWNRVTNEGGYYKRLERRLDDGTLSTLLTVPGCIRREKYFTVPLTEGWRLYEIHPELKTELCEWESEDLIKEVQKLFMLRLRVRDIHKAEDSNVDVVFHDPKFKSRGHQRVAYEFSDLVGHKTLVAYGTGTGKTAIFIGDALRLGTKRNVVVCPGMLRLNWAKHIKNLTGIEPIILAGRAPTKYDYKYLLLKKPEWVIINYDILRTKVGIEKENDDDGNILNKLTKNDDYFPWVELINLYAPEYIGVDESHYQKNPSASQSRAVRMLEAPRKMVLGATPIVNRPGELWNTLNWLHPEMFPYYETFCDQYGYGRSIENEPAKELRSLLETIMIRRTRKDISKNLPPINRIVENYEMSNRAKEIYNRVLMGIYEEFAAFDPQGKGGQQREFSSILPKLNAMIKVCAADKVNSTVERAIELADGMEDEEWNKVLIFTWFRGTCNTIARKLGHEALSFVERRNNTFYLSSMEERYRIVDQFQTDPKIKFLVVTAASAAEGLDITKAGITMFNDLFWTPAKHEQCEGRAFYRESDMHGGDSYYLQFGDTIEDWITELHGIKENTIDKVIEGKGFDYSVTNEIMDRLYMSWKKATGKV